MQARVTAYIKLSENKPPEAESIKIEVQPFHFHMHTSISHIFYIAP